MLTCFLKVDFECMVLITAFNKLWYELSFVTAGSKSLFSEQAFFRGLSGVPPCLCFSLIKTELKLLFVVLK